MVDQASRIIGGWAPFALSVFYPDLFLPELSFGFGVGVTLCAVMK